METQILEKRLNNEALLPLEKAYIGRLIKNSKKKGGTISRRKLANLQGIQTLRVPPEMLNFPLVLVMDGKPLLFKTRQEYAYNYYLFWTNHYNNIPIQANITYLLNNQYIKRYVGAPIQRNITKNCFWASLPLPRNYKSFDRLKKQFPIVNFETLPEIVNKLRYHIKIFNQTYINYVDFKPKKIDKVINLVMISKNHVVSFIENSPIEKSHEELKEIFNQKLKAKEPVCVKYKNSQFKMVQTPTEKFILKRQPYIKKFMKSLTTLKDKTAQEFVNQANQQTGMFDDDNEFYLETYKLGPRYQLDQISAYANYRKNPYYVGFPRYLIQITLTNEFIGHGFYYVKIKNYHDKLFYTPGFYVFTSPELLFLKNHYDIEILACCLFTLQDLDLDNDIYKEKDDNIKKYCKLTGLLSYDYHINYFMCNYPFTINQLGYRFINNYELGVYKFEKEDYPYYKHYSSFIYAYQRIALNIELLNHEPSTVSGIHRDSIVLNKKPETIPENFKLKTDFKPVIVKSRFYTERVIDLSNIQSSPFIAKNILLEGPGGAGKTHFILSNPTLYNLCYVAPTNRLSREKHKEYNIPSTTYHKLLGIKCEPQHQNHAIYLLDEVFYTNKSLVDNVIKLFSDRIIILAGDKNQLLPLNELRYKHKGEVMKFTTNYRCKCEKLRQILDDPKLKNNDLKYIQNKIFTQFKIIPYNEVLNSLTDNIDDVICVVSTNEQIDQITKDKPLNLYRVTKTNKYYSRGDIVTSPLPNTKQQSAFTIHSLQGMTCKKMFLCISKINFTPNMIYTALSRAQYLDDIVLFYL